MNGIEDIAGLNRNMTEAKQSKFNIPRAIIIAAILAGATLISAMYALTIAWGPTSMTSYATSPDPGLIIWHRFFGLPGEIILLFFILNGYIAYTVANPIVQSRVIYAMARDGVFPRWFAVTHKKYKTPYRAVILVSIIALIVSMGLSFPFGPFDAAIITGAMAGIGLVSAHAMSSLAYIRYARKDNKIKYSIVKDAIIPVASLIILIPIIAFAFDELTWPYILSPILAGLWVLGAFIFGLYLYKNKRKDLENAGSEDFSEVITTD